MSPRYNRRNTRELLFYIITPVLFACLIVVCLALALSPLLSPFVSVLDLFAREATGNSDFEEVVLFDPNAGGEVTKPETYLPDTEDLPESTAPSGTTDGYGKQVLPLDSPNRPDSYISFGKFVFPGAGARFGWIKVDNTAIDCALYMGDTRPLLERGAGMYTGSKIPGDNGLTLIGAHTTSFFKTLGHAVIGDRIYISTNYGDYVYEICDIKIADVGDAAVYDITADYECVVLYTCYPFSTLLSVTQRYYVFGRYVSGPVIDRG